MSDFQWFKDRPTGDDVDSTDKIPFSIFGILSLFVAHPPPLLRIVYCQAKLVPKATAEGIAFGGHSLSPCPLLVKKLSKQKPLNQLE
jgi:hypothetical protein